MIERSCTIQYQKQTTNNEIHLYISYFLQLSKQNSIEGKDEGFMINPIIRTFFRTRNQIKMEARTRSMTNTKTVFKLSTSYL